MLLLISFAFNAVRIKTIYENTLSGKKNIEHAARLIREKKYLAAIDYATIAEENFLVAGDEVEKIGKGVIIGNLDYFAVQIDDINYLLSTAEMLSRTAKIGCEFGLEVQEVLKTQGKDFTKLDQKEKKEILNSINQNIPELNGIKANIDLAQISLSKISYSGLLFPFKSKIKKFEAYIIEAQDFLNSAVPLAQLSMALLGYPENSTFLFLLQNNDELRPTGGFIGTYGILETENSDILRMDTHDIYHMDMPVKDKINVEPPQPLKSYLGVDKWFMRDSNWSPDFPLTASSVKWFYNLENSLLSEKDQINNFDGEFDGIIAVTPGFVTDLLKLTGPVFVEGEEYNESNFMKLLEYRVEKGYIQLGIPSWHRKEVIGEIVKELKIRLLDKSGVELYNVFNVIKNNLENRNVIFNFTDEQFQEMASEQQWTGEILDVKGDYIMIVDANMAALKTDAVVNRSINYSLNQHPDGLFADLYVNYAHGGNFDWRTTRYRTYSRIYLPSGSKLLDVDGGINLEEVEIYEEFNKTVFAFFVEVEPGTIENLHFYYELPSDISSLLRNGEYYLYFQKQPGNDIEDLSVDLNFIDNIDFYQPIGFNTNKIGNSEINWDTNLLGDRFFSVFFK